MKTITQTFPIIGMHCTACASLLTKNISQVPGVLSAKVSYNTEKVQLSYNPETIDWQQLKSAVSSLGSYQIILNSSGTNQADQLKKTELNQLKFNLIFSAILSLPVALSMFVPISNYLSFALTSLILFYFGRQFFQNAFLALKKFQFNMDSLIAIGSGSAYLYSSLITFFPNLFSHSDHVYFEVTAVIITLILLGRFLETQAKSKASQAIKSLLSLQVKKARLLTPPATSQVQSNSDYHQYIKTMVDLKSIKVGDLVLVKPGEKIPVDGQVIQGSSYVDQSLVTGESKPVAKKVKDKVIGSTINTDGLLVIQATQVGDKTFLYQIIKLVEQAQASQAPIQALADKVASIFVPIVILIALASFIFWFYIIQLSFAQALAIFISVLIISCPCALGLATPISIMVATGRAASKGILIKNAEKLQIASQIKSIIFDKTGTLTQGKFTVNKVISANPHKWSEKKLIQITASIEAGSQHPIANPIINQAKKLNLKLLPVVNFKAKNGQGIIGFINQQKILIGNKHFTRYHKNHPASNFDLQIAQLEKDIQTIIFIRIDKQIVGAITLSDQLKPEAHHLISQLKKLNIETWLISGDNQTTAQNIAQKLAINHVIANVLPHQKADKVKSLQKNHQLVAMVGDGVNDAPALAQADLGIAMATGTDVAIQTADITLLNGNLNLIPKALALSKKTLNNIKQNLFWAFAYNTILIPVAAGILIPFNIQVNPMFASLAMTFSSLSVVLNALRLKRA